jgi:SAM-dependent methyltransferase
MNAPATKNINKIEFWSKKIIEWENDRYSKYVHSIISGSVNNRMLIALNMLKHCSHDLVVVEAGCGTARLMPLLLESGVKKYIGIDFSPCAIEAARERANELGAFSRVDLIQEDITKLKKIKADLCFSLGLLDWLTDPEIRFLLNNIKTRYYLHSFSEKRMSVQQALHRVYVYLKYGYKTKTYIPRYYEREQIAATFKQCGLEKPEYCINSKMSFSCFAYNLPLKQNESECKNIF